MIYVIWFDNWSTTTHDVHYLTCEQAPKYRGVKKEMGERSEPSVAWGRKKGRGACRLCFDAAHPWYQILVSWSDWSDRWLLTSERKMPTCAPGVRANVIEADAFKRKKNPNLMSLITLLTWYWHMCYRITASGRMGGNITKLTGSPVFFSSPGNIRLACQFSSTMNPFFHNRANYYLGWSD